MISKRRLGFAALLLGMGMLLGCPGETDETTGSSSSTSSSSTSSSSSSSTSSSSGTAGGGGMGQGGSGQGGSGTGTDMIQVNGSLVPGAGKVVPAEADVLVAWTVSSGSPDYLYGYGTGQSMGDKFVLSLNQAPPSQALNSYGIGVGIVMLFPKGMLPPEGVLTDPQFATSIGAAGQYAIIYKTNAAPAMTWFVDFNEGYSCGKGAPPKPGSNFESFAPVDCAQVTITVDDINNIQFVNWT